MRSRSIHCFSGDFQLSRWIFACTGIFGSFGRNENGPCKIILGVSKLISQLKINIFDLSGCAFGCKRICFSYSKVPSEFQLISQNLGHHLAVLSGFVSSSGRLAINRHNTASSELSLFSIVLHCMRNHRGRNVPTGVN